MQRAQSKVWFFVLWATLGIWAGTVSNVHAQKGDSPLIVVVMDPLSDKLACDCVQGYAQRKYEHLGKALQQKAGRPVEVYWGESIGLALEDLPAGTAPDVVIGKHSVVIHEAAKRNWKFDPVASLTGKDGSTVQSGLIVVRKADAASTVADLDGYQIFFGPEQCDEKSAAPMDLLREFEIAIPDQPETCGACSEAAKKLLALPSETKAAAVISSYAAPLLEGCGTIKKGDLRVIGESRKVPFVTAFLREGLDAKLRQTLLEGLLSTKNSAELKAHLETRDGFVPFVATAASGAGEPGTEGSATPSISTPFTGTVKSDWQGVKKN